MYLCASLNMTVKSKKCYHNTQTPKSSQPVSSLHVKANLLWAHSSNLTWPRYKTEPKPTFYRNFILSTLPGDLCTHLAQSPGAHGRGRLFRGARTATFPGGTEGPAGQCAPRCHPAHGAADSPQPQQVHTAGYGRAHGHRNAYLTLHALSFRSHWHRWSCGTL